MLNLLGVLLWPNSFTNCHLYTDFLRLVGTGLHARVQINIVSFCDISFNKLSISSFAKHFPQ